MKAKMPASLAKSACRVSAPAWRSSSSAPVGHQRGEDQGAEQHPRGQRQLAEVGAGAEVEGQRDREERQPDRHALLPARRFAVVVEPGGEAVGAVLARFVEESLAAFEPGLARGGVDPGGEGGVVGEAKDHLEFVSASGRRQRPGAEVAGEVGGEGFAFALPGEEVAVTAGGDAAGHQQGNGSGRHRVSPGTVERASWAPSDNGAAPGVVGCVGGQARIVPAVVAKVRCRVYGSAMTSR